MLPPSFHQRLQDLEDHVTQDLRLLKQYEDKLRLVEEPKQVARYQQEIEQLRHSAQRYRQESDELRKQLTNQFSDERQAIEEEKQTTEHQLNQIAADVKCLMGGQVAILGELSHTRRALIDRYDVAQQGVVETIVDRLDQNQLLVTQELLDALDDNQVSRQEVEQLWAVLEEHLPSLPSGQAQVAEGIKSPELDAKHKLKVTLPIVPFLVDYEGELELGTGFNIKTAWEALIRKLQQKASQASSNHKPIWKVAKEIRQSLTEEDRQWCPRDGAVNHDYYIYGTPKVEPVEWPLLMPSTGLP